MPKRGKKAKRVQLKKDIPFYFATDSKVSFIPSGCTLLDCVLGGGWPIGRISNVIGDNSTGKTLLAIEACANFRRLYPQCSIAYDIGGAEEFDVPYANSLGLPEDFQLEESGTVEEWWKSLNNFLDNKAPGPAIYVLDSLDAISDKAEMERGFEDGTYGTKAKKIGELFRRLQGRLRRHETLLFIVSQVRANIGVTFGKKYKRSGGKALDFYAVQCLWLSERGKINKTRKGVKRPIGIEVVGKCEKNKVGLPYRQCEFTILFNYGMDEDKTNADFLKGAGESIPKDPEEAREKVVEIWRSVEKEFLPTKRKYT